MTVTEPLARAPRHVVVLMAKAPEPGKVKTRLTTAMSPEEAAAVASAALVDTYAAVKAVPDATVVLALAGDPSALPDELAGCRTITQRGDGFDERLAHALADATPAGEPVVLVGMDTPQLSAADVADALAHLGHADAVIGPANDGGWWLLALRNPAAGEALVGVPMSQDDTGALTVAALEARGLSVARVGTLVDVDTIEEARAVAAAAPGTAFAREVARVAPEGGAA